LTEVMTSLSVITLVSILVSNFKSTSNFNSH
jgi:hypothetical protein